MENKLSAGLLIAAAVLLAGGVITDISTDAVVETEATQSQETEQHISELNEALRYGDGEAMFTSEQISEMLCTDDFFPTCYPGMDEPVDTLTEYGTTIHTYRDSNETVTVQLLGTPQGPVVVEVE